MGSSDKQIELAKPDSLQMVSLNDAKKWHDSLVKFAKDLLTKDQDFGIIPGVAKPSLYKPGAEKLRMAFGLTVEMNQTDKVLDLQSGYVSYTYKATVKSKTGQILAECEGNCNTWETKYRYLWVKEDQLPSNVDKNTLQKKGTVISEFVFGINKAETIGQYGKPAEYWQKFRDAIASGKAKRITKPTKKGEMEAYEISDFVYRIQNPDVVGQQNTVMKMSQKRAYVGAILMATGASEFYTQDVEDMAEFGVLDAEEKHPVNVDNSTKTNVEEGQVIVENQPKVSAPTVTQVDNDATKFGTHEKRLKWIQRLVDAKQLNLPEGKIVNLLTPEESEQIWKDYLKFIGK